MDKKLKMSVGIGGPSIIMIFVVLCLTTLCALSLMTAHADWKLTQKTAKALTDYYAADNKAEEILASVDADIKSGRSSEKAASVKKSYVIPVSDRLNLVLELETESNSYTVLSRKLVPSSEWNYDEYGIDFNSSIPD